MERAEQHKPLYHIARAVVLGFSRVFSRLEVRGAVHVPRSGAFILASNHCSYADPPILASACPDYRQINFLARNTLFTGTWGKLLRGMKALPLDRDGDSDLATFRVVLKLLKEGEPLLIFPEGTRSHDGCLQPPKRGVGMIACKAQVPVVPVRVFGTFEMWPRGQALPDVFAPLAVTFGPALLPPDYDPGRKARDRAEQAAANIMEAIAILRPQGD